MRQVIRRQPKALATEGAYVLWLPRYMNAVRLIPPELSSEKKPQKFLDGFSTRNATRIAPTAGFTPGTTPPMRHRLAARLDSTDPSPWVSQH